VVIENLLGDVKSNQSTVCVAYVYCDYQDAEQQTPENVLGALLNQVMAVVSDQINEEIARTLYSQLKTNPVLRLKLEEVRDLLARATHALGRVYICIDALDECLDKNKKPLLDALQNLLAGNHSIRLFLIGRSHIKEFIRESLPPKMSSCYSYSEGKCRRYQIIHIASTRAG
jgi:hypothetical protein